MMHPQRVVSLWNMINAGLHHLLDSQSFVAAFTQYANSQTGILFDECNKELITTRMEKYREQLSAFGLQVAAEHVRIIIDLLNNMKKMGEEWVVADEELRLLKNSLMYLHDGGLQIEASIKKFFIIDPQYAIMLDDSYSFFGDDVDNKFPAMIGESQEAAKCLALGRWTASAFHFLRCLEVGVRAISRCLDIDDPTTGAERNWSSVSRKIRMALDARWPNAKDKASADYHTIDAIYASIAAMQNPYRNETMHFSAMYTEQEARHLSELVRGLMQRIAARCDENGLPLA